MVIRLNGWLARQDRQLSAYLSSLDGSRLAHRCAVLITRSGDALPALVILLLAYLLGTPGARLRVLLLIGADIIAFLVVQILKVMVRRERPVGAWGETCRKLDPFSFPSGHAARGGAWAGVGIILGPGWLAGVLIVWGILVALSRVVIRVHYLSDSVAGFLTGMYLAWLLLRCLVW